MALSWSDISSQSWFTELAPEQKAKALDVWTQDTLSSVTDPAEREQLEAASEFGKLKYLGQPLPAQSLEEFVPIFQEQKRLKAADEQGLLTQLGGALQTGLRDVTTGLGVTFDALTGDNEELAQGLAAMNETDAVRQQNKTTQDIQFEKALAENAQQFKDAKGFWPTTKELADYVGITLSNPTAFAKMVAESAPNALVSIGAQAVGAGAGALVAGAGGGVATGGAGAIPAAFAGGTAGAVAANVPLEIPGSIRQKFLEVTKGEGAKMTPEQIKQVLDANPEIVSEGALKGTVRGTAIGVVEGLTAGVAGKVATIPERAAERAVLAETAKRLGKEAATRLDAADYILKNPGAKDALAEVASKALSDFTVGQRVTGLAGAGLIETAGEGAGELVAQVATGEEIDPTAIYQEVAAGLGMAGASTALARSIEPARQIVQRINASPELQAEKQNLTAAENLVQQAAADPNTVASVAAAKAVINQGDQNLVEKAATAVAQEFQAEPVVEEAPPVEAAPEVVAPEVVAPPVEAAPEVVAPPVEAAPEVVAPSPVSIPAKADFDSMAVGTTYTDPEGTVWTRRESQFGEPVMVAKSEGGQLRLPTADFAAALQRLATPPISPADITAGLEPQPPTQTTEDATLQGQVPENRIKERVQADEGGTPTGPGSRDQPEGSGQVQAEVQTDEVAPTAELPDLEEGYLPKTKSTVRVNRSLRKESRMTTQRNLKFGSSGKAVPLQGVGNDKRSSMLLSKLLTVFGGKKGNTGAPDSSRIISINSNSDQAIVEDKDGILKLFAAGGDGDTWMYIADVEPTIPPQGVVPTESLPEGQVTPGGAAVPLVTPARKPRGRKPATVAEAEARIQEQQAASEFLGDLRAEQAQEALRARKGKFVSDNAANSRESVFLADLLRGGWDKSLEDVQAGRVTPERANTLAQAATEAGLIDAFTAGRFAVQQAQVSPEIRNTLQAEIASLPPVAQTRWTPDVVADAESYIQTGNQDAYKRLTRPQQNLVNRVRERLGITDEQDAQEAEMERQMRLDANTKGSPYRNQIEQSIDLPAGQDLGLVSEADFEAGMRIVEGLIRNARATVIQDTRANLLASADLNEAEKDAFRRGAQGIYSRGRAIIARDNIRATSFTASPAQAAAAVVFHELMHKGSDILKSDPRFAQEYADWLQMLNENVTDDMIRDVVARTGYRNMADWQTNPTSKLRAQEEVFVRQMERFFQRGGRLVPAQAGLLARFKEWIGRVVERALGTPIAGNLRDDILQDWGRKFIKAVQSSNEVSNAMALSMADVDAEYMAAVESGDMAKAQRMVDEAAKAAGYGSPTVFRGDFPDLKEFQTNKPGLTNPGNVIFSSKERLAGFYMRNPSVSTNDVLMSNPGQFQASQGMYRAKLALGKTLEFDAKGESWDWLPVPKALGGGNSGIDRIATLARKKGFDSLVVRDVVDQWGDGDQYFVFNSNQIKSADPVTYDDAGNVILLSQRFQPESPDIRFSMEFPATPTPETRTGVDRISTFDEDEKVALRSFMKGDQSFDKLKQFLGVEEGGELGRTESLLPLKMAAIDTIGFSEDKSGAPVVSKRATENAFEIARQLLDPTTNFGVTYQQEVGEGAESAATAVLQMELTRYALAMARKGDNRLLATMRQNWNSVVLGAYITATASGRILRARADYVSDVLRTIDKMDAEAKKQAKKRLQSLGMDDKEAEATVRDLDAVIQQTQLTEEELNTLVQDMLKTAEGRNFENTNPPDDWVGRAVSKLGEDDQRMVNQLFRQLFELDQIEKKLAEVSKTANGPEASFLDSFVTDDVTLPDSVEELEQLRDKTKKNISDLLSKLTKRADANPEVARKVKEATKKTPAPVTDEVSDFIKKYEDKLKKPISKKKTQAELDLEKLVRDQVKVPLSEADFIAEASVFGATEAQARRLYSLARVEASLLTAERGKTPTKLGKLVRYLQSVPSMAKDPQGRSLAIESFLRDNGYTDEQINRSKEYLEKAVSESMVKAKQAALDRMISRAEKKTQQKLAKKAEEDLATRLGGITGKAREILMRDLKTIRSGLGDKETDPSMKLAEALGFSGFRPNDYKSLAELDIKITQANLEGRLHDASEGVRELYELLGRRKAPKNLIEQLGIAYNYGALSSLGSLAIQVISPLGAFVTRFTMDMTRALARRDVNLMKLTVKSFIDSMKRVPLEAAYGLKGGASTVTMNQQVFAVTRLSREMSDAADTLMRRGRQSPERRKERGLSPRPNALEMVKAGYSWLLTSSQIIGRVLSTADHVANNMMKNYFTKTEAAKTLLAGTDMPYEAMVARLFNISTTVNAQLSYEKDSLARLAMEMKQLKEDGKYSKATLLDLLAAPLPEGLSQSAQDFERDLRGNLRRVVEAYDTVPKLERHILREMSRQKTAAETRANDRMRVELLRDIEGRVTPQAAAQVQDFAAKETDYEMGTHRGENAPTADIFNTFTNLVRDVGQSVKSRHPLLGTMVLGYFGIPVNLLNRAMWFTPWGLVRAGLFKNAQRNGLTKDTYYQMSMATTAQFQQRLMEAIGGTAAVALLMALKGMDDDEDEGFNVTLSGPSNKTEFDAWSKQGHRKGSLEYVSKDGTVTSLNWARGLFEPLKVALLMVGAMDDMRLNRKIGEQATGLATTISEYLSAVLYGWSKQAAFFGAKNTIGTFLAPAVDSNAVAGSLYKLGPLVPYNGLISSVEKFIAGPDRFYGREGAIWLNLPIARSLMTERAVNALGDPQGFVANTNWSDLNDRAWYAGMPLMVTGSPTGNDKKVYDFILQRGTGPGLPQRGNLEEKNGLMSDTKWLEFVRTRGQILKTDMIRNMPRLEALDDEALARAYSDMSEQATRIAKRRMGFQ